MHLDVGRHGCPVPLESMHVKVNIESSIIDFLNCFQNLKHKKIQGKYRQYLSALGKYDLLILDEFLLTSTTTSERENLLELIESRTNKKSTIYCSQWTPSGWHEKLGGGAVADGILDRIVKSSYMIELKGNSLREEYSRLK